MTTNRCVECNSIALYRLTFFGEDHGVVEGFEGWYCKPHFLSRLELVPSLCEDILRRYHNKK